MANLISLPDLGAALTALSALSTASFGLLDATKAFGGGISNIGAARLKRSLQPFRTALDEALGPDAWWPVVRANWVAGVAKAEQKAKVQALIRLGLSPAAAPGLAKASRVDPEALAAAAKKLESGRELTEGDLNVLGRMNAAIEALMDAAFEACDQEYRNTCRLLAGLTAMGLAVVAWALWPANEAGAKPTVWAAIVVGLLAVPLAPVAKDLTSALSTAMRALKASRRV
jgi:hypothetical protein